MLQTKRKLVQNVFLPFASEMEFAGTQDGPSVKSKKNNNNKAHLRPMIKLIPKLDSLFILKGLQFINLSKGTVAIIYKHIYKSTH